MALANLHILPSTSESREDALRLVFGHFDPSEGGPLASSLSDDSDEQRPLLDGLFEARSGNSLVGAVWVQRMPGKTAVLWAPVIVAEEEESTRGALMRPALEFLAQHDLSMVQTLVDDRFDPRCEVLKASGFEPLVDLQYLVSHGEIFPKSEPRSALCFEPLSGATRERLVEVIEQTYTETRDCPKLCGVRAMADVLDGYQNTGVYSPDRWWIVCHKGLDVGCLLLTDNPAFDYFELLYMGVVPEERGNGWGREIIRFAQWQSRLTGRSRLVLAVDSQNQPALASYAACDFVCWERKSVYWRRYPK